MLYIFPLIVVIIICCFAIKEKLLIRSIKRNGVKVTGTIIYNSEQQGRRDQLGGNINNPIIRFITKDGQEITGRPVEGFISQHEVRVPSTIIIVYDSTDPQRFYLDPE